MLNCSRIVGQLTRITRHGLHDRFANCLDTTTNHLRYSTKNKKPRAAGTTAKVEECLPPKTKSNKRVPPLPQPPPPPPIHSTAPAGQELKPPESRFRPSCEEPTYSCPPNCPPDIREQCHKSSSGGDGSSGESVFNYWKQIVAALVVAGVSTVAYIELFEKDEKSKKVVKDLGRQPIVPRPEESDAFPKEVPYLLIGGGTAAFSAFRAIKAGDPTAKVLVITNEGDLPYMRPPLSKELWYNRDEELASKLIFKQWNGTKRSLFYEPPEFYLPIGELENSEKGGVSVATGWTVKKIDVPNKTVYLQDNHPIKFDKCLIATGASPKNIIPFEKAEEKAKEKIIVFRTKEDYLELVRNIKKPSCKNIVIVGGGFLGSELSTSLARNRMFEGQQVYQLYKEKNILAQVLPEYLSEWTTKHSQKEGVNCVPNVEVHDCRLKNDRLELTLNNGKTILADQVVVAVGVKANTELAKSSNLETDPVQDGFLVNAELEARSNVWVAGDVACFYDVQLGRRRIEHHDHAVISGRLAGENMTGSHKPYTHQSMFWSDLGPEVGFEAIGIINSSLETVGVFAKSSENESDKKAVEDGQASSGKKLEGEDVSDPKLEPEEKKSTSDNPEANLISNKSSENSEKKVVPDEAVDDYAKGVIFYVRDKIVVGIVLWNIFNRMSVARQILARGTTYDEINEVAKLFEIHED
ncbi:apoptosis-inducing factor 1, mitochondrial [Trichogramma pretiosum]|uniref:apoptosis-inducing factor 1, mitochondrial n=1 Tax=Trichogramma pretiosum TaxID=7493 RepID=UPI0006C9A734|nr:apoptosis-inducing factor 1, mitochondrial [Trichogramma pretiosum]